MRTVSETPAPELEGPDPDRVIEHRYDNEYRSIASIIRLYHGVPHGITDGFYPNENQRFRSPFVHGKLSGIQQFFDPSGQCIEEISYVDDIIDGIYRRYDRYGNIIEERYYSEGKSVTLEEYYQQD